MLLAAHPRATETSPLCAGLARRGLAWRNVLYVHLGIADMAHFAAANTAYCAAVPQQSAPARACVQLPACAGCACTVEALVATGAAAASRRVLHVQSISEWAPACIGPYGQATVACGLLSMAGQIPLDPATMTVRLLPIGRVSFQHAAC